MAARFYREKDRVMFVLERAAPVVPAVAAETTGPAPATELEKAMVPAEWEAFELSEKPVVAKAKPQQTAAFMPGRSGEAPGSRAADAPGKPVPKAGPYGSRK